MPTSRRTAASAPTSPPTWPCVRPGDTVLAMSLDDGGHLSHGSPVNFSGLHYNIVSYGVSRANERIDMDEVRALALKCQPQMIIAGASAYPRIIDFAAFASIAREVGASLMVDIAHIAGLVAGGAHPSPVPHADIVTSTSHKTLRGPRGGFLLTNDPEIAQRIDKSIFPGSQGGPLMHVIAAKAVAFGEALQPQFKDYAQQIVTNMQAIGRGMAQGGLRLVSGGTDNHLALVDLTPAGITGKDGELALDAVGITVNKNAIPFDSQPHAVTSGIRVGAAAMTTRGIKEDEAFQIGQWIARAVFERKDRVAMTKVRNSVQDLLAAYPLYPQVGNESEL